MSIKIENNLISSENKELFEQRAHYMPCKIEEDGPANVNKYFEPYITETNPNELTATFRGRPLDGAEVKLRNNYSAVLVTEAKRPLAEHADRKFQVARGFRELTNWNWDKRPSRNDPLSRALDWIHIAEAIHGD